MVGINNEDVRENYKVVVHSVILYGLKPCVVMGIMKGVSNQINWGLKQMIYRSREYFESDTGIGSNPPIEEVLEVGGLLKIG